MTGPHFPRAFVPSSPRRAFPRYKRFINLFSIPLKSEPWGDTLNIKEKILALKEEEGIAILAHNYQPPGIQDVADFLGDSLDLCYRAQELDNETILFAGVRFMAESALILNPDKTVLIPNPDAFCPMAAMLSPADIRAKKEEYPDAPVVLYGNTNAASKAHADVICTSANALRIVESLDADPVLFGPDRNLRHWVATHTDKELVPLPDDGYCYVHNTRITEADIRSLMQAHPDASDISVAQALEDEQPHLMPMPAPFDGYIERPVRISSTALTSIIRPRTLSIWKRKSTWTSWRRSCSSASIIWGLDTTALAIATRCCCPPDNCRGKCFLRCVIFILSIDSSTRFFFSDELTF